MASSEALWRDTAEQVESGQLSVEEGRLRAGIEALALAQVTEINHDQGPVFELVVPDARWLLSASTHDTAASWRDSLRAAVRKLKPAAPGSGKSRVRRAQTVTASPRKQEQASEGLPPSVLLTGWMLREEAGGGGGASSWNQLYGALWDGLVLYVCQQRPNAGCCLVCLEHVLLGASGCPTLAFP